MWIARVAVDQDLLDVVRVDQQVVRACDAEPHHVAIAAPAVHERLNDVAPEIGNAAQEEVAPRAGGGTSLGSFSHQCLRPGAWQRTSLLSCGIGWQPFRTATTMPLEYASHQPMSAEENKAKVLR